MLGIWELCWFLQHVILYPITYKYHNNICIYFDVQYITEDRYIEASNTFAATPIPNTQLPTPLPSPSCSAQHTSSYPGNPNLDPHHFPYPNPFSLSNNLSEIIYLQHLSLEPKQEVVGPFYGGLPDQGRLAWPEKGWLLEWVLAIRKGFWAVRWGIWPGKWILNHYSRILWSKVYYVIYYSRRSWEECWRAETSAPYSSFSATASHGVTDSLAQVPYPQT